MCFQKSEIKKGPEPAELFNDLISLLPPVLFDAPVWMHNFGDVLQQPPPVVHHGQTVNVTFVSLTYSSFSIQTKRSLLVKL